jgi:hypothetical protein
MDDSLRFSDSSSTRLVRRPWLGRETASLLVLAQRHRFVWEDIASAISLEHSSQMGCRVPVIRSQTRAPPKFFDFGTPIAA